MMNMIKKVIHWITSDKAMNILAYVGFVGITLWGLGLCAVILIQSM